jgi:hypothetical protein
VAEQRYQTVLAVISDGLSVSQVAEKVGVPLTTHSDRSRDLGGTLRSRCVSIGP